MLQDKLTLYKWVNRLDQGPSRYLGKQTVKPLNHGVCVRCKHSSDDLWMSRLTRLKRALIRQHSLDPLVVGLFGARPELQLQAETPEVSLHFHCLAAFTDPKQDLIGLLSKA